jgi:hypothetical protein
MPRNKRTPASCLRVRSPRMNYCDSRLGLFGLRRVAAVTAFALALTLCLTACGGGSSASDTRQAQARSGTQSKATPIAASGPVSTPAPSGDVVVRVGSAGITKATINHWMGAMVGGDVSEHTSLKAPQGLVGDPAHVASCMAGVKALMSRAGAHPASRAQLASKCRELNIAIRQQALMYLIESQWAIQQGVAEGIVISDREVAVEFQKLRRARFPKASALREYLSQRNWALSDELYLIKHDLISRKTLAKFAGAASSAFGKHVVEFERKWLALTRCQKGYVVEQCRDFEASKAARVHSPALLIEEMTRKA